jgi:hypothetical protein
VADYANFAIRLVDLASGNTSTLAGNGDTGVQDGAGYSSAFCSPKHTAHVPGTDFVLIADVVRIRMIDVATGVVSTTAGAIPLTCAHSSANYGASTFDSAIECLAVDSDGLTAFVGTCTSIFRVSVATGSISRIVKTNQWSTPFTSLVVLPTTSGHSRIMVADNDNHFLWTFEQHAGASATSCVAAGSPGNFGSSDGQGTAGKFKSPASLALMAGGATVVVWQYDCDNKVRLVNTTMDSSMCGACSCIPSCMPRMPGIRALLASATPFPLIGTCRDTPAAVD